MKTPIALAAAALLALAAPAALAADKAPERNDCFWARNANGFAVQDDHTLNVLVNSRDVYQFEMMGHCPDMDWNMRLGLRSVSSTICRGMDAEVITHSPIGPMRCPVRSVRKLTKDEIAALPRKARP